MCLRLCARGWAPQWEEQFFPSVELHRYQQSSDFTDPEPAVEASPRSLLEATVAARLRRYADTAPPNDRQLCTLNPEAFARTVLRGNVSVDDGDWVQPLFQLRDGVWELRKMEVVYRITDPRGVPFPSFVDLVKAATDETENPDVKLRAAFGEHLVASIQRVDTRLSQLSDWQRAWMSEQRMVIQLNATAKQLEAALNVNVCHRHLIALEETEYDLPPPDLRLLRLRVWKAFGAFSLDDVKPTVSELEAFADNAFTYQPARTSQGADFKALPKEYTHGIHCAREFIAHFAEAKRAWPAARAELKFDEVFCCHALGVGHAPFARGVMAQWREDHPEAFKAAKRCARELIGEALAAGLGICFEVSFEDAEVQWLLQDLPALGAVLLKQGGESGPLALPLSLLGPELLPPQAPCRGQL